MATAEANKVEVQLAHEREEWRYATYAMGAEGCLYSRGFDYDADKLGDKDRARKLARADFDRLIRENPSCSWYDDLTGKAS